MFNHDDFNPADPSYQAGGFSYDNLWNQLNVPDSFSGIIGRIKNNLSGATAANESALAEAERNRLYNSAEARTQRDWEERMASTSYQRTVADMKKAGLNPALLSGITGSSASSVGSGSAASSSGGYSASSHSKSSGIIGQLLRTVLAIAIMK